MSTNAFNQTGVDLPDPEPIEAVVEEEQRPTWLPSKFKDESQFVESYGELERKLEGLVRDKEEAEQYAQAMAEQLEYSEQNRQQQYYPQDVENNPLVAQWEQALEMGDARTQLALAAYVASQIADQKIAAAQQPTDQSSAAEYAQAGVFARVVEQDVQAAYEGRYNEPWEEMRARTGDFLAENPHWLQGVQTPDEAVQRISQAADFVRMQSDRPQEQAGNPQRSNAQKYLGQTLQGHGARTQVAQDAASELVERMRKIQGPYGYSG
jgi:hypothetical protein